MSLIESLLENECECSGASQDSQLARWNKVLSTFGNPLRHNSYGPGDSDYEIRDVMSKEHTKLQNFWFSMEQYRRNLAAIETDMTEAFQKETSDYAAGMTRQIYEVSASGEMNMQRIRYLSQKSPDSYTPEEISEIHRLLAYTTQEAQKQNEEALRLGQQQNLWWNTFLNNQESMDLNKVFRGYRAALKTTYGNDVSKWGDAERLSEYFYQDTLKKLSSSAGGFNFEQLNYIMELNPDSLTVGDYKALSMVFDEQVSDPDSKSLEKANLFLANCYINAEFTGGYNFDAERSPVFDQWAMYYLGQEVNMTSPEDFEILGGDAQGDHMGVHTKFLKQALLGISLSNAALKLQLHRGSYPADSETIISHKGIFEIGEPISGLSGDYSLNMYKSYKESGEKIEIDYYRYRESNGMSSLLEKGMVSEYEKYNKDFLEYTKDQAAGYVVDKVTGAISNTGVAFFIDGAVDIGKFGGGWYAQTKENEKVVNNLNRYFDGRMMQAYQQGGQIMYVNDVRIVNNLNVDEERLEYLQRMFEKQVHLKNDYYDEFLKDAKSEEEKKAIKEGLLNPESAEYKVAFTNWYFDGTGDREWKSGVEYEPEGESEQ